MKKNILCLPLAFCFIACVTSRHRTHLHDDGVKTTFQTGSQWRPSIDNRADAVMIYGIGGNPSDHAKRELFEDRVRLWKEHGYVTHFMTGIAWGEYQDYFTGAWDGKTHFDEGQVERSGDTIWHGPMVPYIVPSDNYLDYLKEKHVKRAIDAGIDALFMEEPEFWARAGYSESFKKEWKQYYGFDWRPQHESPENTWLSNKLKYKLYYDALKEVFTYAKAYGKTKGMDVKCYVPTHSLVNYSQWGIVSPEASLASLDCVDGYIAQVWTGTSRTNNYYDGRLAERVFETAYLEYGSMESMTAPTKRKMFFLTDPIEDWPRDWDDYKRNYEATYTAQLMYPEIANYEVMPWPERIYDGLYKVHANSNERTHIPQHFSTQMQVMVNTLNKMPLSNQTVSGSEGISVLMSNSLMFQSYPSHRDYSDPQLSNFFGLAFPFLKRGIPVKTTHIENLSHGALKQTKVLLMSYTNHKPLDADAHQYLAQWVKQGGILIYSSRDADPFQTVMEWWNQNGMQYAAPSDHLFSLMDIPQQAPEGIYRYGKGAVQILRNDPKEYVLAKGGDKRFVRVVDSLYATVNNKKGLIFKNSFYVQRGMYDVVAVLNEGVDSEPYCIEGLLIDLFNPELPVITSKQIQPGSQGCFINMERVHKGKPMVLASGSREESEIATSKSYSYVAKGPERTIAVSRVYLPAPPVSLKVNGVEQYQSSLWDATSHTYLLHFNNHPDGVKVEFRW